MPISGLVVTLREGGSRRTSVLEVLASDPRIEVGEARGGRIPIVTETVTPEEAEDLARELAALEGIYAVDVVCIDTSLDADVDLPAAPAGRGFAAPALDPEDTHGPA